MFCPDPHPAIRGVFDGREAQTVRQQGRGGALLSVLIEVVAGRAIAQNRAKPELFYFQKPNYGWV